MHRLFAEVRPDADTEYLASALIRDAVRNKFKDLFGREPVERTQTSPMRVDNGRVPDLVLESVDANISKLLKASAIESSDNASGNVPEINNCTLLYTVLDDTQAQIALEGVKEYQTLDTNARDATIQAVNELDDVKIKEGVAYISPEHSTIRIGLYVDNKLLGEEFQYRLEAAGGKKIDSDGKVKVFDTLFNDLPGGDKTHEADVRSKLMGVVGLGSEAPAGTEARQQATEAPGPEPVPTPPAGEKKEAPEAEPPQKTESLKEVLGIGGHHIGLPGVHSAPQVRKTVTVDGQTVYVKRKSYHGSPNGWACVINGKEYYSNRLEMDEAIKSCIEKSKSELPGTTETNVEKTESIVTFESLVREAMATAGFGWKKLSSFLKTEMDFFEDEIAAAQNVYVQLCAGKETNSFYDGDRIFEVGASVSPIHAPGRLCVISAIYADKDKADLKLVDLTNADSLVLDSADVIVY